MSRASLDNQLSRLATLSPAELRTEWQRLYKTEPPRLTADLLRIGIGYAIQERALGKLPARTLRAIRSGKPKKTGVTLSPGTQLLRSWNGRSIVVMTTESGFEWEGRSYRSLSEIAREVTGARWSGPRFFGLTDGQNQH